MIAFAQVLSLSRSAGHGWYYVCIFLFKVAIELKIDVEACRDSIHVLLLLHKCSFVLSQCWSRVILYLYIFLFKVAIEPKIDVEACRFPGNIVGFCCTR